MINFSACPGDTRTWSDNYATFSQLLNGILTTLCVVIGISGNIYSIKAVHMANMDKTRRVELAVSLLALAIWDAVLLACAFCYYGFKNLTTSTKSDVLNIVTPFFHAMSQISNTASIWCVVSITVQRYMATRDPFRSTRSSRIPVLPSLRIEHRKPSLSFLYCSVYRRHFRIPILLTVLAFLINLPAFFEIETKLCYRMPEGRLGYGLYISQLRLNSVYKLWYKVIFRMVATSCGPNIVILSLTVLTVRLLRGSNRSRQRLFQMSETLLDRYNSKETMQTMISLMLVIKFLALRSLSFMLDIWEVTVGYGDLHSYIYVVDISNFLILLNSATNCLIFIKGGDWIQNKVIKRNTMRRKRQLCVENLQSLERVNMIHKSWQNALYMTNRQLGVRVLYSMLLKNPQMVSHFNPASASSNSLPVDDNSAMLPVPPPTPMTPGCPHANGTRKTSSQTHNTLTMPMPIMVLPKKALMNGNGMMMHAGIGICPITAGVGGRVSPIDVLNGPPATAPAPTLIGNACPAAVNARTAEVVAALPHVKKRSLDLLGNPIFHEVGDRIMLFMGELIDAMRMGQPDQNVIRRLREVGALHQVLGITFTSAAWKEFKSSTLAIIEECDYEDEVEQTETIDAWRSFLSVIIREMKMGISGYGFVPA